MLSIHPIPEIHKEHELRGSAKISGVEANLGIKNKSIFRKANPKAHHFEDIIEFVDLFVSLITALFIITPRRILNRNWMVFSIWHGSNNREQPMGSRKLENVISFRTYRRLDGCGYFVSKRLHLSFCPPTGNGFTTEEVGIDVLDNCNTASGSDIPLSLSRSPGSWSKKLGSSCHKSKARTNILKFSIQSDENSCGLEEFRTYIGQTTALLCF
ncbi:hypothetical protein Tco_0611627 [Tanacetum coccineum]